MTKWEYRVEYEIGWNVTLMLDLRGSTGWELVNVMLTHDKGYAFFFKRPVTTDSETKTTLS